MTDSGSIKSEGTCSSINEERERARIVQKVVEIKDRLKSLNEDQERDVVKFLSVTRQSETTRGVGNENPQLVRIRNNFERQNRKYTGDREELQKKLDQYNERLRLIDKGEYEPSPSKASVISQGLRKAGANVKGMRDTVMTAPMEFAQKIKTAFGSADNVNVPREGRLGQSTFFTERRSADGEDGFPPHNRVRGSSTLPPNMSMNIADSLNVSYSRPGSSVEDSNMSMNYQTANNSLYVPSTNHVHLQPQSISPTPQNDLVPQLIEQVKSLKQEIKYLDAKYENLKKEVAHEIAVYSDALEEERYNITRLEKKLNDTIELHQAEFESLKEQSLEATRVDYQHNDKFKTIEERIESVQNQMIRMENSIADTLALKLSTPVWGNAALSGANILVEILKIVLFVVASILDFIRPLTGSRNRAGLLVGLVVVLFLFGHHMWKIDPRKLFTSGGAAAKPDVDL